jgi:5-methylcytosine-specific restriction endonuclease McrA
MKIDRAKVHSKYNGHCGYCGKEINIKEMQIDHMIPKISLQYSLSKDPNGFDKVYSFDNLMPSCKRCNHYKRSHNVEEFRYSMKDLHKRLEKIYINNVAVDFGMIEIKPFNETFFFETYNQTYNN